MPPLDITYMKNQVAITLDDFRDQFMKSVDQAPSILLTTAKCDEDAIASLLSLYFILHDQFPSKKIKMVSRSFQTARWNHFKNFDGIDFVKDISPYIANFPLVIFCDSSQYHYWGVNRDTLHKNNISSVCIDHHGGVPDEFNLSYIDPNATSTSELIYNLFLSTAANIHPQLAEMIIVGIMGDTSSLRIVNQTRIHVYEIIKRLLSVQDVEIYPFMILSKRYTSREIHCIQEFLRHMTLFSLPQWPDCVAFYISRRFFDEHQLNDDELSETSSFVANAFCGTTQTSQWGIVLFPKQDGSVRIKLRSHTSNLNVRKIVEELGIGGGHNQASGGTIKSSTGMPLDSAEALEKIKAWLSKKQYDRILERILPYPKQEASIEAIG